MRTCILSQSTHTEIISRSLDPSILWHKLRLLILYFRYLTENMLTTLPRELFHNLRALNYLWVRSLGFMLNGYERFALFSKPTRIFILSHFRFSHVVELSLTWIVDWKTHVFCYCILQARTCILSQSTHTEIISGSLDPSILWHKLRLLILYFRDLSQNKLTTLPRELFHNWTALTFLWLGFLWFVLNGNESFALFSKPTRISCVAILALVTLLN